MCESLGASSSSFRPSSSFSLPKLGSFVIMEVRVFGTEFMRDDASSN